MDLIEPAEVRRSHRFEVSQNKWTPIWTPEYYNYYNPSYWDPQEGTPNFGKVPSRASQYGIRECNPYIILIYYIPFFPTRPKP